MLLAQVKGMSGSTYIIPLLVSGIPLIIADLILDETNWELQVLQTIKKSVDLNSRALLVVSHKLLEFVSSMVNPERITVVAFENELTIPELMVKAILEMRSDAESLQQPKIEAYQEASAEHPT